MDYLIASLFFGRKCGDGDYMAMCWRDRSNHRINKA